MDSADLPNFAAVHDEARRDPAAACDTDGINSLPVRPPPLHVLYRDRHYVAICKPAGLLVHPTPEAAGDVDTVVSRLPLQLEVSKVWPVHRLDRGTSGVLVSS